MNKRLLLLTTLLSIIINASARPIENPKARWKFQTQGPIRSAAVVDERKIYFGSSDGFVYALNKASGEVDWKYQTGGAITASPTMAGSRVIVSSRDNFVYVLDSKSGALVWKFQMQSPLPFEWGWEYFTAAPVGIGERIFVASGDGQLYALSAANGKLVWKFSTNARLRATPLVLSGKIYQPCFDGKIYIVDAVDGKLFKTIETEGAKINSKQFFFDRNSIYAKPCVQDSLLLIGSRDGNSYCFNVNSGRQKWKFSYGPTWAMSSAIDQNVGYIGWSDNNTFCAIDLLTGKEKWKFEAGGYVYTTPQFTSDEVFIGSGDSKVYCLDKGTGAKKWEYQTKGPVYSSPLLDNNILYVGSDDGSFYAIEEGVKPHKGIFSANSKVATYFKEQGFEQLDSANLYKFLSDRIADKSPSVIVFRSFMIPSNIVGEQPETGLIRRYLESGGKIVWPAEIPNFVKFDKGRPVGYDVSVASKMLGVKFDRPYEGGSYYSKATQLGMNWGLPAWLLTTFTAVNPDGVTALAVDEFNRPVVWIKKFNPRSGSGFIYGRLWNSGQPAGEKQLSLLLQLALNELE